MTYTAVYTKMPGKKAGGRTENGRMLYMSIL